MTQQNQSGYEEGEAMRLAIVTVNVNIDLDGYAKDLKDIRDNAEQLETAYPICPDRDAKCIYKGEIVWERIPNRLGGDQTPNVRSVLNGSCVSRRNQNNVNIRDRQLQKRLELYPRMRILGFAQSTFHCMDDKHHPGTAVISGYYTAVNTGPFRITRGDLILARLPFMEDNNIRRSVLETIPLTPTTLRTEVIEKGELDTMLQTESFGNFMNMAGILFFEAFTQMMEDSGGALAAAAAVIRGGAAVAVPDRDAIRTAVSNITQITPAGYTSATGAVNFSLVARKEVSKAISGALLGGRANDLNPMYLRNTFCANILPVAAMSLNPLQSRLMGVAGTSQTAVDLKLGSQPKEFEILACQPMRLLTDALMR